MIITPQQIEIILQTLRQKFPGWNSFDHPDFVAEEITYKRAGVDKAQSLLEKEALETLLANDQYDEFMQRLKTVGTGTNLLYNSTPNSGDLNILSHPDLDQTTFTPAIFDLLWGEGDSPERLHWYLQYVTAHNLPNKWTFPTYFLFLCRPDSEMFVKPYAVTRPFLRLIESDFKLSEKPDANSYDAILQITHALKDSLSEYSPQDMVDIQSLMWVCAKADGQHTIDFAEQESLMLVESEITTAEQSILDTPERIFKIAPGQNGMYWPECRDGHYICIGWDELGDLSAYGTKEEFIDSTREWFQSNYPHASKRSAKINEIWKFRTLQAGDVIIANQGASRVLGVGDVMYLGYKWRPERTHMKHTVAVRWRPFPTKIIPAQGSWPLVTLAPVSQALYLHIIGEGPPLAILEPVIDANEPEEIELFEPYIEPPFAEIVQAISEAGMRLDDQTLRRYHLSLKTRKFVILSGISGGGKTWLARLYAEAVGAQCAVVHVAPNWTANEDLLGYWNPINEAYQDTVFSRFLRRAAAEYHRAAATGIEATPFHLVLDEMNLARVEYYFAKFLSTLEIRAQDGNATIELGPNELVDLPPNLFFIGTVNMDETTHGFADKVYDRAQLIEIEVSRELLAAHLEGKAHQTDLMQVWDAIHHTTPFAFRVLDEIQAYLVVAETMGISWEIAFDEQLLHKILPKFKGTDHRVGEALQKLVGITGDKFPLTHQKSNLMLQGFQHSGFVSFF